MTKKLNLLAHQLLRVTVLKPLVKYVLVALGTGYGFLRSAHRLHVFPRGHRLHVFPHTAPVTCFPKQGTGCMFSRGRHRLHVFPRKAPVACFPAQGTGCMFPAHNTGWIFSRARHRLHVFPRTASIACFLPRHRLHVFPCTTPAACFSAHGIDCMFPAHVSRAWNKLVSWTYLPVLVVLWLAKWYQFNRSSSPDKFS